MSGQPLDPRTTPARPDLAAAFLRSTVEAAAYVKGETRIVSAPLAPLRREPRADCPLSTEAMRGERALVFDEHEGWAWVQLVRDGYVGYLPSVALGRDGEPTHKVAVLRTLVFPEPDLKLPVCSALPLGSCVAVREVSGRYARIAEGWVAAAHLAPLGVREPDFVAVAEQFIGVPYLWGGKSSLGLDCSGLVQVALAAAGIDAPRDSDMQEAHLGTTVAADDRLRRGDLVFWPGHVGILRNADTLLHANAHAMMVTSEPLAKVQARAAGPAIGAGPAVKRLPLDVDSIQ